jgi:predicted  nucleic acid-binding Zn-ribbon protein
MLPLRARSTLRGVVLGKKKEKPKSADVVTALQERIRALKEKVRAAGGAAKRDTAARALRKRLRRAQRRRRSLIAFAKSVEARRTGKKATAPESAPPAPAQT